MNIDALVDDLSRDEGFSPHAYQDTLGYWTIGFGRMIDKRRGGRITRAEAELLLAHDAARSNAELDAALPWWRGMSEPRQRALANMCFNMGLPALLSFRRTLAAMERGDYGAAADGMLASKWARQVGQRAERLADMMRAG